MLFSGNEFFIFKVHYSRRLGTHMCRPMEQLRPSGLQIWFIFEWALLELSSFKKHLSHPGCWIFWHNTAAHNIPCSSQMEPQPLVPSSLSMLFPVLSTVFFQLVILTGGLSMVLISSKNQLLLHWFFFLMWDFLLCVSRRFARILLTSSSFLWIWPTRLLNFS